VNLPKYYNDPDNQAQNLNDLRGKTLRLNPDGSIPTDNPFYHQPGKRGEIFTRGHRQPWRTRFDPVTGGLYLAENGGDREQDFEEINLLQAGANYGWPRVYGDNHDMFDPTNIISGFTKPWLTYPRYNGASCTCALFYRADSGKFLFPPEYRDVLFYSDYNRKSVRAARVDPKTNTVIKTEQFAFNFSGGPVSARVGPDGALYLAEYGGWFRATRNDRISRIIWAGK
jgi:glucose/arabinose dehydrogenase